MATFGFSAESTGARRACAACTSSASDREKAHERHRRTHDPHRNARARACDPAGHSPDPPRSVRVRLLHRQVAVQRGGGSLRRRWRRLVSRRNLPGQGGRAPPVHRALPIGRKHMSDIAALTTRIETLEHELAIQQDIHQIRRVQYAYGYFIDKSQYNEVVDLFADDGDVWFLGGIYRGKAGVRRLYIERFRSGEST